MARDRQRAKARRAKRQPGAGGPASGSARTRARDIGLDQAEADDAGLGNTTPPEPTKHAFPDVEEARLAEAGPVGFDEAEAAAEVEGDPVSDDDGDAVPVDYDADLDTADGAPDEVEGDLVPTRGGSRAAGAAGTAHLDRPRRKHGRLITFLGHCVDELRRVQWPDRRQVGQGTAVVFGFVALAGGYLGLLDAIWKPIIQAIL